MNEIKTIIRGIGFMIVGCALMYGAFIVKPADTLLYFLIGLFFSGALTFVAGMVMVIRHENTEYTYTEKKITWM